MAEDDSTIWVDIAPRLDEREAERSVDKLRDKFRDASHSIGDSLKDASRGAFDSLEQGAERWASNMAKTLDHGGIGEALDKIGLQAKGVTDVVAGIGEAFGLHLDSVQGFGKTIGDALSGAGKAADSLSDVLHGKLPKALQDVTGKSDDLGKSLKNVSGLFDGFNSKAPGIEGAFGRIGGAIGKVVGPAAALYGIFEAMDHIDWNHIPGAGFLQGLANFPGDAGQWIHDHLHMPDFGNLPSPGNMTPDQKHQALNPFWHPPRSAPAPAPPAPPNPANGGNALPSMLPNIAGGAPGVPPGATLPPGVPNIAPPDAGGGAHTSGEITIPPGLGLGGSHVTLADFTTPDLPSYGLPPGTNTGGYGSSGPQFPAWVHAIERAFGVKASTYPGHQESNRSEAGFAPNPQHLNRGIDWTGSPDAMERFAEYVSHVPGMEQVIFQNPQTGQRFGIAGGRDVSNTGYYAADYPDHTGHVHTRQSQAIPLPGQMRGPFSASPAGFGPSIPGVIGSPAGLPGGPVAPGGGLPGAPGGGSLPIGTLPNINPTNTYGQQQAPQLGSGSGFGLTGGGLIGMAEQAASMAAGAFSFGGGSMAAQLAFQELNLAVQKGGQMAATAAMAPLETLWLSGGQMGAQSVGGPGQSGWIGKLLGGMVGSQFGLPNIAGTAQPPKQQKQPGEADESKLGAGLGERQQGQQQGQGGGATPGSSKDNPLYTKSAAPPASPPQGAATSAASMHAYMSPMIA